MRKITSHKVNSCNEALTISVIDDPGPGGANHHYMVTLPNWTRDPDGSQALGVWDFQFQNGAITEAGVNGITHEVLLAIVLDRLTAFQNGPYKCAENEDALQHVQAAMQRLKDRTMKRVERGVEGTMKV